MQPVGFEVNIRCTQGYDSKELQYGALCYIPYFQILDISNCNLDHFYLDNLLKLPALLSLNVSNNQLIKIDVEVLETLVHLQRIDLKT
jgi:Leucine-rich repeat (LRR) protein